MGKILKPKGLTGNVRVMIFNEENSALKIGSNIWLIRNEDEYFCLEIEALKIAGRESCIKFAGFNHREDIEQLNGLTFSILRNEFPPLLESEFYLVDLIGSSVLDENRNIIGSVIDTISLPTQNVLVVDTKGKEILIPYVDAHILLFDEKEKILIMKDVEGYLN